MSCHNEVDWGELHCGLRSSLDRLIVSAMAPPLKLTQEFVEYQLLSTIRMKAGLKPGCIREETDCCQPRGDIQSLLDPPG